MARDGGNTEPFESLLRQRLTLERERGGAECPPASILAAWSEGGLGRAERERCELHFAGCGRCAEILAAMARMGAAERGPATVTVGERLGAWGIGGGWRPVMAAALAAAATVALVAIVRTSWFEGPAPSARPASANQQIALANSISQFASKPNTASPSPGPVLESATGSLASSPSAARKSASGAANESQAKERREEEAMLGKSRRGPIGATRSFAAAAQGPPASSAPPPPPPLPAAAAPVAAPPPEAAAPPIASVPARIEHPSVTIPEQSSPPTPMASGGQAAMPPAALAEPQGQFSASVMAAGSPAAGTGTGAVMGMGPGAMIGYSQAAAAAQQRAAQAQPSGPAPIIVQPPDRAGAWNVGPRGTIYHYDSSGGWRLQNSGVSADLIAGSAPSAAVCWVAGRGGTVLRTVDGGAHWERIGAPAGGDFVSVLAQSASAATIVDPEGRRYSTSDGGISWR